MSERNSKVNSIDVSDICTYETFQFCLFNAERLLDDSNKVSPPTQTALLEIALEECGKALIMLPWMVINKLKKRIENLGELPYTIKVEGPKAQDFGLKDIGSKTDSLELLKIKELLSKKSLNDAFYCHTVKLSSIAEFLNFIKNNVISGINEESVRGWVANPTLIELTQNYLPITDLSMLKTAISKNENTLKEAVDEIHKNFDSINISGIKKLNKLKEDMIYVNYDRSISAFVFPTRLPDGETENLKKTTTNLIELLRVMADFLLRMISVETTDEGGTA